MQKIVTCIWFDGHVQEALDLAVEHQAFALHGYLPPVFTGNTEFHRTQYFAGRRLPQILHHFQ